MGNYEEVLQHVLGFATADHFDVLGLDFSPIKGGQGNIEFLAHLTLDDKPGIEPDTALVVRQAHETLKG